MHISPFLIVDLLNLVEHVERVSNDFSVATTLRSTISNPTYSTEYPKSILLEFFDSTAQSANLNQERQFVSYYKTCQAKIHTGS